MHMMQFFLLTLAECLNVSIRTRVNTQKQQCHGTQARFPLNPSPDRIMMSTMNPNTPMTGKRDEQKGVNSDKEKIGDDTTKDSAQIFATSTDDQVGFSLAGLSKLLGPLGI
jgi:hypothetical protein